MRNRQNVEDKIIIEKFKKLKLILKASLKRSMFPKHSMKAEYTNTSAVFALVGSVCVPERVRGTVLATPWPEIIEASRSIAPHLD